MTRLLRRVAHLSFDEVRVRGRERAWTVSEAAEYAMQPRWRRTRLQSRLLIGSRMLERARHAITRSDWAAADAALREHFLRRQPRFVLDPAQRERVAAAARTRFPVALEAAVERAESILAGRYDLLGFRSLKFARGDTSVDWHFDPVHGRSASTAFWSRVRYLDPAHGDHKIIWELNRHQHWLALGRAAWLTGDQRYAAFAIEQLEHWMQANPPLTGINWASMLELAFRSISWIWAFHFFLSFDHLAPGWIADVLLGLERQLTHVSRHLSFYFSPNTHLLGEALALYTGGRVLPELTSARRWEHMGREILLREVRAQIHADGAHAEQSLHYHRYALDFYLLALAIARRTDDPVAEHFAAAVSRLAAFCRAVADDNGRLPAIGDDDGGLLFPICGRAPTDARDSLSVAAALLGRPDLAIAAPPEEAFWMLGGDPAALLEPGPALRRSRLFPDSGYVVLRDQSQQAVFDAGPHGFLNGGHAHADALSLVLTVGSRPLLIDPGTATYTMDPGQRDRFRSTAMHNTIVVDGRSQAVPAGPFHWQSRANGRVSFWKAGAEIHSIREPAAGRGGYAERTEPRNVLDYVEAAHDGYAPIQHRRGLLRIPEELWLVVDRLTGSGLHQMEIYWHFHAQWRLIPSDAAVAELVHRDGLRAAIASTARHQQDFLGDQVGLGWSAPRYGQLTPSPTLRFADTFESSACVCTVIAAPASSKLTINPLPAISGAADLVAVSVQHGGARILAMIDMTHPSANPARHHKVQFADGEFSTDARVSVLRLTASDEPSSLTLVQGTQANWTGRGAFTVLPSSGVRDLHWDGGALRRLSQLFEGLSAEPLTLPT